MNFVIIPIPFHKKKVLWKILQLKTQCVVSLEKLNFTYCLICPSVFLTCVIFYCLERPSSFWSTCRISIRPERLLLSEFLCPPEGSSLPSFVPPLFLYYSTCRINDTCLSFLCFLTGLWTSLCKGNVSFCTECLVSLMLVWPEWEGLSAMTQCCIMKASLTVLWIDW